MCYMYWPTGLIRILQSLSINRYTINSLYRISNDTWPLTITCWITLSILYRARLIYLFSFFKPGFKFFYTKNRTLFSSRNSDHSFFRKNSMTRINLKLIPVFQGYICIYICIVKYILIQFRQLSFALVKANSRSHFFHWLIFQPNDIQNFTLLHFTIHTLIELHTKQYLNKDIKFYKICHIHDHNRFLEYLKLVHH